MGFIFMLKKKREEKEHTVVGFLLTHESNSELDSGDSAMGVTAVVKATLYTIRTVHFDF